MEWLYSSGSPIPKYLNIMALRLTHNVSRHILALEFTLPVESSPVAWCSVYECISVNPILLTESMTGLVKRMPLSLSDKGKSAITSQCFVMFDSFND